MTELRHPNIVQFLGLCFLEESALPVLVMERLDSSLDNLLETSPSLPLALKQSLLVDVARGLLYLHTHDPPVVHEIYQPGMYSLHPHWWPRSVTLEMLVLWTYNQVS